MICVRTDVTKVHTFLFGSLLLDRRTSARRGVCVANSPHYAPNSNVEVEAGLLPEGKYGRFGRGGCPRVAELCAQQDVPAAQQSGSRHRRRWGDR